MEFDKTIQIGDMEFLRKKLKKILIDKKVDDSNFVDVLINDGITWHCGGMSDPFQPIEENLGITKELVDISNEFGIHILFSTKSDTVYNCNINPKLHTFQLSVTNVNDLKNIEPNVPCIKSRLKFFEDLKRRGFKVGIRIQPFIPNISTLEIVKMFKGADNFTLEGIKIVPQNAEHKDFILDKLGLNISDFKLMGLLNLRPSIRLEMYQKFIDYFKENGIDYSIADNDLRFLTKNKCCCGDSLVNKSTSFNSTSMITKYGIDYAKEQIDAEVFNGGCRDCKSDHLFTSNRTEGCVTVQDFYDKRFYRKSSPFSPLYQYRKEYDSYQLSMFDFDYEEAGEEYE